jgi:hypothetical protein
MPGDTLPDRVPGAVDTGIGDGQPAPSPVEEVGGLAAAEKDGAVAFTFNPRNERRP